MPQNILNDNAQLLHSGQEKIGLFPMKRPGGFISVLTRPAKK